MPAPANKRSAITAWLASLPLALAIPAVLWISVFATRGDVFRDAGFCLTVVAISIGVHLSSYLLTGLPIFLCMFRDPQSVIWKLPFSLIAGALLGAGAPFMFGLLSEGSMDLNSFVQPAVCAGYGVVTAIAAYLKRPTLQTS